MSRNVSLRINLGVALANQNQATEAETLFRDVIRDYRDATLAYFQLGKLLVEQGSYIEGGAILREALRIDVDNVLTRTSPDDNPYNLLEFALFSQERYGEAKTICQETIRTTSFAPAVFGSCDRYDQWL